MNRYYIGFLILTIQPLFVATCSAEGEIEEIVVSAHQLNRTVRETQHSIDVFSPEFLEKSTFRNFDEIVASRPNMEVDPREGIIVRGTPRGGYGGNLPSQLSLIDGAYSPGIIHFWDASQVEILKGAQSSVGSSVGGTFAVNYQPATFTPTASVLVNYSGEANDSEIGLAYSNALVKDRLAFKAGAYSRKSDGFIENTLLGENDWAFRDEQFYRAQLRWLPDDSSEFSASVLYLDVAKGGRLFVNRKNASGDLIYDYKTDIDVSERFDETKRDAFVHYRKQLDSGLRIHAVLMDHRWNELEVSDTDLQATDSGYLRRTLDNKATGLGSYFDYDMENWQFSGLLYGIRFDIRSHGEFFTPIDFDGPGPLPGVINRIDFHFDVSNWWQFGARMAAIYNRDRWNYGLRLLVLNYTAESAFDVSADRVKGTGDPAIDQIYENVLGGIFPTADTGGDLSETSYNPGLSVSYDLTEEMTIGVMYERAQRAGWADVNVHQAKPIHYDPEIADEYNISWRSRMINGRWVLNANLFYTDFKDTQLSFCFSDALFDCNTVNAGESHRLGLEMNSDYFRVSLLNSNYLQLG
jgi:iron complex outermembrane receptor protein